MSYKPKTLFRLIGDTNHSLFLPHIQRPFVWDREQMRRLFDSLMRNYPIQTLLFWRTKNAIKPRKFMDTLIWDADLSNYYHEAMYAEGIEKVFVLDGQQRLQTLYVLFNGKIESNDEETSLEAWCDIAAGETADENGILYPIRFEAEDPGGTWYRLRNLSGTDAQRNAEEIADDLNDAFDASLEEDEKARKERQRRVRRNCGQLVSLLREEKHFWVQELDGVANDYPYERILEIFVRVNSGGTKLDAADLMFAAMKEGWEDIEANIENIVGILNENRFRFDKNVALKCIVTALGRGAELSPSKFTSSEGDALLGEIEANWDRIENTFRQLRDFIFNELLLFGDKVIRSYNAFVPLFDHLYHNPSPDEANRVLMKACHYKAQLFNWFGARTDGVINAMHSIVGKPCPDGFPMAAVCRYFGATRETRLTLESLHNMTLRYIVLNMIYVEKFNQSPFNVQYKGNQPHIDHIYPQSMLRSRLELPTVEINSIGNYRFVGGTDNIRKRAELPDSYFTRLKAAGVDIERHLLLEEESADPGRLKFEVDDYRNFRDRRLEKIFEIGDRIVNAEEHQAG